MRRPGLLIVVGLTLMLLGAGSAYGLGAVQREVIARVTAQVAPTASQARHAAQRAAATIFRNNRILAVFNAPIPARVYSTNGSHGTIVQRTVVMVIGRQGRAAAVAWTTFSPYSKALGGVAASGSAWSLPFVSTVRSISPREGLQKLPSTWRGRVQAWLVSQGVKVLAFGAWPFPQGLLVVVRYRRSVSIALFPPSGSPKLLY
jgi:hypothetical protein